MYELPLRASFALRPFPFALICRSRTRRWRRTASSSFVYVVNRQCPADCGDASRSAWWTGNLSGLSRCCRRRLSTETIRRHRWLLSSCLGKREKEEKTSVYFWINDDREQVMTILKWWEFEKFVIAVCIFCSGNIL